MDSEDKPGLLKTSLKMLSRQLSADDSISLVVYAGAAGVVLEATAGNQTAEISRALDRLSAGGSTNGAAVEPEILIIGYGVDYQRVAFPPADGVAVVAGLEIKRVGADGLPHKRFRARIISGSYRTAAIHCRTFLAHHQFVGIVGLLADVFEQFDTFVPAEVEAAFPVCGIGAWIVHGYPILDGGIVKAGEAFDSM